MKKVFLDTNIILDVMTQREPFILLPATKSISHKREPLS